MNLLVIEDDKMIREGICELLSEFGCKTYRTEDGKQAVSIFENNEVNLAILDIRPPYTNGLDVLKKIRETGDIPAIMLTAFSDEEYKINASTSLADGYIGRPFSLPVLKVRVESLIKKYYGNNETFNYKDTGVNFTSYTVKLNGKKVDVNAKELEVLKYMIKNEGQVFTRMQIIDSVWKEADETPFDRVVDVYVKELHKKLELDCIVTIRDVGYKLEKRWKI